MATGESPSVATEKGFHELSREEGWALLDCEAQRYLQMGAEDFLRKWDAGEFKNRDDRGILRVASLIPFVR